MTSAANAGHPGMLPVGDPRRPAIGRAVVGALTVSAAFFVFLCGAKEIRPLYVRTPWQDDPYDAIVSFAIFFLPLLIGLWAVRILLCRKADPLPVQRVAGQLLSLLGLAAAAVFGLVLSAETLVGAREA